MKFRKIFLMCLSVYAALGISSVSPSVFAEENETAEKPLTIETSPNIEIDQAKVDAFISRARDVIQTEKHEQMKSRTLANTSDEIINYNFVDDDNISYFYESNKDEDYLFVTEVPIEDISPDQDINPNKDSILGNEQHEFAPTAVGNLPDGIGGKATVVSSTGGVLSTLITTATESQMNVPANITAYIYAGFTGGKSTSSTSAVEADLGLQYSTAYGRAKWKPAYLFYFNGHNDPINYPADSKMDFNQLYNQVQYQNGFVPGTNVTQWVYRNYSDANVTNAVRLKQSGTAICADMNCSKPTPTQMISILEIAKRNVTSINSFKLLATLCDYKVNGSLVTPASGAIYAKFSSIKSPVI